MSPNTPDPDLVGILRWTPSVHSLVTKTFTLGTLVLGRTPVTLLHRGRGSLLRNWVKWYSGIRIVDKKMEGVSFMGYLSSTSYRLLLQIFLGVRSPSSRQNFTKKVIVNDTVDSLSVQKSISLHLDYPSWY